MSMTKKKSSFFSASATIFGWRVWDSGLVLWANMDFNS